MNRSIILFFFTLVCFRQNSVAQSTDVAATLLNRYLTIQEKRIGFNGVVLIAKADKEHLYAKLGNNPTFEIYNDSYLEFYGKKMNVKFIFQPDQEGLISGLLADGRGQILTFNKK